MKRRAIAIGLAVTMLFGCETAVQKQERLCKTEAKTVRTAAEAYFAEPSNGSYATSAQQLVQAGLLSSLPTLVVYSGGGSTYTLAWTVKCATIAGIGNP